MLYDTSLHVEVMFYDFSMRQQCGSARIHVSTIRRQCVCVYAPEGKLSTGRGPARGLADLQHSSSCWTQECIAWGGRHDFEHSPTVQWHLFFSLAFRQTDRAIGDSMLWKQNSCYMNSCDNSPNTTKNVPLLLSSGERKEGRQEGTNEGRFHILEISLLAFEVCKKRLIN